MAQKGIYWLWSNYSKMGHFDSKAFRGVLSDFYGLCGQLLHRLGKNAPEGFKMRIRAILGISSLSHMQKSVIFWMFWGNLGFGISHFWVVEHWNYGFWSFCVGL